MYRQSFAPIKEGDELEVTIEAVGEKGDGLAKKDGFVVFVPNTKPGDKVKVKITRVLRKVGFAEVVGQSKEAKEEPKEAEEGTKTEESGETEEESEDFEEEEDSEDFGED